MYNPYSVLSAFVKKEIKSYWFGTGTPTFLVNYLKEAQYYIPDLDGNVAGFMERLRSLISNIPYDNYSTEKVQLREQNYQAAVYLVFVLMGQFVQTEVHCVSSTATEGVADCVVETGDSVYLFEFKLRGSGSAAEAIEQIKERQYATPHLVSGKKVVLIGVSFDEEARTIKEWAVASG